MTNTMKLREPGGDKTDGSTPTASLASDVEDLPLDSMGRPLLERSYTFFPQRRVLKSPDKQIGIMPGVQLPKLGIVRKGIPSLSDDGKRSYAVGISMHREKTNAMLQAQKYGKFDSPSMPTFKYPWVEQNRIDSYMNTRGLHLGQRTKTNLDEVQIRSRAVNYQWINRQSSNAIVWFQCAVYIVILLSLLFKRPHNLKSFLPALNNVSRSYFQRTVISTSRLVTGYLSKSGALVFVTCIKRVWPWNVIQRRSNKGRTNSKNKYLTYNLRVLVGLNYFYN